MHGLPTASAYGLICAPLVFAWMATDKEHIKRRGYLLYFVLAVTLYGIIAPSLLAAESAWFPMKYDPVLFRLDAALGFSVFAFSAAVPDKLYVPLALVYKSMPFMVTMWGGLHLTQSWGRFRGFAWSLGLAYGIGGMFYLIVPACGPG